jgi:hypothetical protein
MAALITGLPSFLSRNLESNPYLALEPPRIINFGVLEDCANFSFFRWNSTETGFSVDAL